MSLERAGVSRSIPSGAKALLIFGTYGVAEATPLQNCNIIRFSKNQSCDFQRFLNLCDQVRLFDVCQGDVDGRFGHGLLCFAFLFDGREVDR